MKRYRIRYRDAGDSGCPEFSGIWRGYDKAHAMDRFLEAPDGEGWEILGIELVS